jgi:hypothetical protein
VTRRPSRAKTAAGAGARNVTRKVLPGPVWSGRCPAGRHGLDYPGQTCDLCPEITAGHTDAPHVSDVIAPVHADYRGTEPAPGTRRILPAPTDGANEED